MTTFTRVRPRDLNTNRTGDIVRNLLYPVIPIFAVACIWSLGYASSMESKVTHELGPPGDRMTFHTARKITPDPIVVTAADRN